MVIDRSATSWPLVRVIVEPARAGSQLAWRALVVLVLAAVAVALVPMVRSSYLSYRGATALAGGDHLHLEIFVHGQSVDPLEWLDGTWIENNITAKLNSEF